MSHRTMESTDTLLLSARFKTQDEIIEVTIESYICLFVFAYCDLKIKINFIDDVQSYHCTFPLTSLDSIKYVVLKKSENLDCNESNLFLPAIHDNERTVFISGLCAVLRYAIKSKLQNDPDHFSQSLLGFRGGCLVACTESSMWTKFCELQMPSAIQEVAFAKKYENDPVPVQIPESLVLLEAHLKRPVRTHNILKRKLDIAKQVKKESKNVSNSLNKSNSFPASDIKENFVLCDGNSQLILNGDLAQKLENLVITEKTQELALNHSYLEGIDLTLADMIVFPCVHYLLNNLPSAATQTFESILKWYERLISNIQFKETAKKCGMSCIINLKDSCSFQSFIIPTVNQDSLYQRDPSHTKMRIKHQNPKEILCLLKEFSIEPKYGEIFCTNINWTSLPEELHPATGDLPPKRVERKCQQIESIVTATLKVAIEGQTIVEFCAGGGHVGLLLAYFLPKCKVILIENKESSMQRAISRAKALKLKNILFYQCNLDYFKRKFDLGVSLHACGVATDLVIQQCLKQQASFVCCPCCYGSIQNTHLIKYPLSEKFKKTGILYKKYTLLAHCADRTEVNTPTAEQGELCMSLIDTDRKFLAEEWGYNVVLTTLQPKTCSPKHNLLVGVSPKWNKIE